MTRKRASQAIALTLAGVAILGLFRPARAGHVKYPKKNVCIPCCHPTFGYYPTLWERWPADCPPVPWSLAPPAPNELPPLMPPAEDDVRVWKNDAAVQSGSAPVPWRVEMLPPPTAPAPVKKTELPPVHAPRFKPPTSLPAPVLAAPSPYAPSPQPAEKSDKPSPGLINRLRPLR